MFFKLFLLFTIVPAIELVLLLKVGTMFGFAFTLVVVILTGMLGAALAKQQGLQTVLNIKQAINHGKVPTTELVDGFLILIAGVVLITPGLLTDATGFILLIPACRAIIRAQAVKMFKKNVVIVPQQSYANTKDDAIDVNAKTVDEEV